ncbi:hypothetical protein B0F90DRAFT_1927276 [Multifurca ochricompacta]|uniref:Uncharacterized protein n=1 Tax=Multifurca ochricompacta TaxID=376703 RepID=A0AAD4QK56_9AGAM|nr:hypothetical protein B0F90DRAFT_1927276 [Multifurca ochricompacta]
MAPYYGRKKLPEPEALVRAPLQHRSSEALFGVTDMHTSFLNLSIALPSQPVLPIQPVMQFLKPIIALSLAALALAAPTAQPAEKRLAAVADAGLSIDDTL